MAAQAGLQAAFDFDIPPQPLSTALEAYVRQTGVQILSDGPIDAGLFSPGVSGSYTGQAGLAQLLKGAGFTFSSADPLAVTLSRPPSVPAAPQAPSSAAAPKYVLPLPMLRVEAAPPPRPDGRYFYGTLVKARIAAAVRGASDARQTRYDLDLDIWLQPQGLVSRVSLRSSTGDKALDARIAALLDRLPIGSPPPPAMPQPVRVRVSVN
jgi:hypothetical protein